MQNIFVHGLREKTIKSHIIQGSAQRMIRCIAQRMINNGIARLHPSHGLNICTTSFFTPM